MEIQVTCLCGAAKQNIKLAASSFPIDEEICHCNSCRLSSGAIGGMYLTMAAAPDASKLVPYQTSDKLERYFCPACGSHMFVHTFSDDHWSLAAGCVDVEGKKDDVIKLREHAYVGDTKDGGLAGFLLNVNGREIPCYEQDAHDNPVKMDLKAAPVGVTECKNDEKVLVKCHCGGVECYLYRSATPFKPGLREGTWWLRSEGKKFRASACPCRSCRLWIGQPLQPWMFCEEKDVRDADGKPVNFEKGWGTLKTYESTPETYRSFCGKCGASFVYRQKERARMVGAEVIDISIGLLRADSGVRAEEWCQWDWDRMGYQAEGLEREIIDTLLELGKKNDEVTSS